MTTLPIRISGMLRPPNCQMNSSCSAATNWHSNDTTLYKATAPDLGFVDQLPPDRCLASGRAAAANAYCRPRIDGRWTTSWQRSHRVGRAAGQDAHCGVTDPDRTVGCRFGPSG